MTHHQVMTAFLDPDGENEGSDEIPKMVYNTTKEQVMFHHQHDPDDENEAPEEDTEENQLEITPGVSIGLSLPPSYVSEAKGFLPSLREEMVSTTKELILGGAEITGVIVEVISANRLQINYYHAYGKIVKEKVIPILAFYAAKDMAQKFVKNTEWDKDLISKALKEISDLTREK